MAPLKHKPRTTGFVQKPKPTLDDLANKKAKPPGYCVAAAQQQARVIKNKAARNQLGSDGFPRGKKLVNSLLKSQEMAMAAAIFLVGMRSFGNIANSFASALFAGIGQAALRAAERSHAPEPGVRLTRRPGDGPQAKPRRRMPKPTSGGGDSDGGSTAPRSSKREDLKPDAWRPPLPEPRLTKRQESSVRGKRAREAAAERYGDPRIYALLASVIAYKPGMQENPRDDSRVWDKLALLHPDLPDYLKSLSPTSVAMRDLRAEMDRMASRIAGSSTAADRDDLGAMFLAQLEVKAAKWREGNPSNPSAAGPTPEANDAEGGVGVAPRGGPAPKDDDTPSTPKP